MQTPSVGRIVHVLIDPAISNGSDVAAAVITRAWGENGYGGHTVNYRILVDQLPEKDRWVTSALLFADRDAADAYISAEVERRTADSGATALDVATSLKNSGYIAFWPERV